MALFLFVSLTMIDLYEELYYHISSFAFSISLSFIGDIFSGYSSPV